MYSYSFLTVCNEPHLLGWHIALIVVGGIALVAAIVMITVNGIVVLRKRKLCLFHS